MKVLFVQFIVDIVNADDVCVGLAVVNSCDILTIEEKKECIVELSVGILIPFIRSKHVLK